MKPDELDAPARCPVLCRLGLHRFSFYDRTIKAPSGLEAKVITYAWCRRLCPAYGQPSIVNIDTIILSRGSERRSV